MCALEPPRNCTSTKSRGTACRSTAALAFNAPSFPSASSSGYNTSCIWWTFNNLRLLNAIYRLLFVSDGVLLPSDARVALKKVLIDIHCSRFQGDRYVCIAPDLRHICAPGILISSTVQIFNILYATNYSTFFFWRLFIIARYGREERGASLRATSKKSWII
jgi:hypothetical protein